MSKQIHVKPSPGKKIRHPDRDGRFLPDAGEMVTSTPYWRARLRDGDVVEVTAAPAKAAIKAPSKPAEK